MGTRGLSGDRCYMLIDDRGRFLSQREHPRMALISVEETPTVLSIRAAETVALELPHQLAEAEETCVSVWNDELDAAVASTEVNHWFSAFLGLSCRLVYMAERHHRAVPGGHGRQGDEVSFADGAPLLLASTSSLDSLNTRLANPVTMLHFRPNLVVSGSPPFAEDEWRLIRIGEVELEVSWPCARCVMTTVDPSTGIKAGDREPLATLGRFRRSPTGALFGQNLIPRKLGLIRVGDAVEILL